MRKFLCGMLGLAMAVSICACGASSSAGVSNMTKSDSGSIARQVLIRPEITQKLPNHFGTADWIGKMPARTMPYKIGSGPLDARDL